MIKKDPSIYNDVIGPVMKGPSSSHTAGPTRIGLLARQLLMEEIKKAQVVFAKSGSFAMTYKGQGTDKGLVGGLLGYNPQDDGISTAIEEAKGKGLNVEFILEDFVAEHPNTARITLYGINGEVIFFTALSLGGGMVEIIDINGFPVSIGGDSFEILAFTQGVGKDTVNKLSETVSNAGYEIQRQDFIEKGDKGLINIKLNKELTSDVLLQIKIMKEVRDIKCLSPVMPVLYSKNYKTPFSTGEEMLKYIKENKIDLWEAAADYESSRSGWTRKQVFEKMKEIIYYMEKSVKAGLSSKNGGGKILKSQAGLMKDAEERGKLVSVGAINMATAWAMSVVEVNSALGVVVAAPTAGSCGVLPGAILGTASSLQLDEDRKVKAMLAAGGIGLLIAQQATFAAEVCGCQAECGAASAMAAAGVVELAGGTHQEAFAAASLALQNLLGLICDPVAELVEVPCLGKNVMAAANAVVSANMALAGVDAVIPLDEVIKAMYQVGVMLPRELRCTGLGGVAVTETGQRIKKELEKCQGKGCSHG